MSKLSTKFSSNSAANMTSKVSGKPAVKLAQPGAVNTLWNNFWSVRSAQERKLLGLAAAVVVLALVYSVLVDPALRGRAALEKSLPAMRLQAADMQALSREAAQLAGKTAPTYEPMSKKIIGDALVQHGINGASVAMVGDFAKVQIDSAAVSALMGSLSDLQKTARVTVTDVHITAQTSPGLVNATLTLRQLKAD